MTPLVELAAGQQAVIHRLEGGRALLSRLAALGFTPGAGLTMLRNGASGPLLVSLRGSRVALGRGEAAHVLVAPPRDPESGRRDRAPFIVALAGQPNVGKSSVFNALTGLNQHVGNWTGKTVEGKIGSFRSGGQEIEIMDLPGTYSLTASSEEERLAREALILERPDLVVCVVNAASLEHSLYLVAELIELDLPVVVALNMLDVARQEGVDIRVPALEQALGVPVVPLVATRGTGLEDLKQVLQRAARGELPAARKRAAILPAHQATLDDLQRLVSSHVPPPYPPAWAALKLLEGDEPLTALVKAAAPASTWAQVHALLYQHEDAILDIAGARYEWIARCLRSAVVPGRVNRTTLTTRLDRVLTHPVWGTAILIALLGAVFYLTYALGSPLQAALSRLAGEGAAALRGRPGTALPAWLIELAAGGLLGGIGMVLTFLPILAIFFILLGLLEDTGYMARVAFLSDRWMHRMGLHGKSFLPLLLGFGCNVPAVLTTRIIESRRARLLTTLLVPLVPCTARLAVLALLASVFFGAQAFWVAWSLVLLNLVLLVGVGMLLHHFLFENEHVPFIMELPLYHLPNARTIAIYVWDNLLGFLKKAGTTILAASLAIWALSYFPNGDLATSFLGRAGQALQPVGDWMGLPWPALLALLTSFVAKENTIATLGVIYGDLSTLPSILSPSAGLAFLVFQMLFIPCVATVAALHQETRSWKWTLSSLGMQLGLSLGLAVAVFQVGRLF